MSELKAEFKKILEAISKTPDAEMVASNLDHYCSSSLVKFARGFEDHGGSILDRPLLGEALCENMDEFHYISAIAVKRNNIIKDLMALKHLMSHPNIEPKLDAIINKLKNL